MNSEIIKVIDSHAHLDGKAFDSDRAAVIERAFAAGLEAVITVGVEDTLPGIEKAVSIAAQYESVFATVGVHPHDAKVIQAHWYEQIKALAEHPKVVGVGETGLDYYYLHSPKAIQQAAFESFLSIAQETGLPVVIHTRDADEDTVAILSQACRQSPGGVLYGVVHCFSGEYPLARQFLDMGLYLSFTGVITFPKAESLREVIRKIPLERVLIETDCPYLSPVPFRGRRNEPARVIHVAETMAQVLERPLKEIARITTENTKRLFRLKA